MRDDELEMVRPRQAQVPGLAVEGSLLLRVDGPLRVDQEGLADVTERDRLVVVEGFDRRVLAVAPAGPRPEQRRQRGDVGVKIRGHARPVPSLILPMLAPR